MSLDFNGTSQYLSLASALLTAPSFTVSAWFLADNITTTGFLFGIGDTAADADDWGLSVSGGVAGDPVEWVARRSTTVVATSTTGYSAGVWNHACGIEVSATERYVLLNGGSQGTNTTSRAPTGLDTTRIGARVRATITSFFAGLIGEVAVWDVALDRTTEVPALARGVPAWKIRPLRLVSYIPLWGVHNPEIDLRGTRTWTLVNGPTLANHAPVARWRPTSWASVPLTGARLNSRLLMGVGR